MPLLERDRRGVRLTPAGGAFLPAARRLLADADRALAHAREAAAARRPLRVSFTPSVHRILVSRLRQAIAAGGLELDVVWVERTEEVSAADLLGGLYDLVLGRYPPLAQGLRSVTVLREQPAAYVARADPLARAGTATLGELAGRRVRMFRRELTPRLFDAVVDDLRTAGIDADMDVSASYLDWTSEEMHREIRSGECTAIGFASAAATLLDIAVVPLTDAKPVPVTVTFQSADARMELRAFVELARDVAAAMPAFGR